MWHERAVYVSTQLVSFNAECQVETECVSLWYDLAGNETCNLLGPGWTLNHQAHKTTEKQESRTCKKKSTGKPKKIIM